MTWWQIGLSTILGTGGVTLLVFILSRSQKATELATTAMQSMKGNLDTMEKMRTAMYLQALRIDQWERWGRDVSDRWGEIRDILRSYPNVPPLPTIPRPPEGHLDLSHIFEEAGNA